MTGDKVNLAKGTPESPGHRNDEDQHEGRVSYKLRHIVAIAGAGLAIGVGVGIAVESHTDEVARGKVITAEHCLGRFATETIIDQSMLDCLHNGVPGGKNIHTNQLRVGDPIDYVHSYIQAQQAEAASIEVGRVAGWSISPFVVAAAAAYCL